MFCMAKKAVMTLTPVSHMLKSDIRYYSTLNYKKGRQILNYCNVLEKKDIMIFFRIEVVIDDADNGQELNGGTPGPVIDSIVLGKEKFKGCISNLYSRR